MARGIKTANIFKITQRFIVHSAHAKTAKT